MDEKNEYPNSAIVEPPSADAKEVPERLAVGREYFIPLQTSQPAPLPEEIPSALETAEEARRAATRKAVTQSFWSLVRHQYKKNRVAVYALYMVYFLFGIAILADVLANDKPL